MLPRRSAPVTTARALAPRSEAESREASSGLKTFSVIATSSEAAEPPPTPGTGSAT